MTKMQTPSEDHTHFDAICARVEDWEPLPAVASAPAATKAEHEDDHEAGEVSQVADLDGLILAGLVSP
jgi:hypothetical protein